MSDEDPGENFDVNPAPLTDGPVETGRRPLRELIEAVMGLLRSEPASADELDQLLTQLADGLDQDLTLQLAEGIYDDAVLRAPWLTADAERLKQQQAGLQQSLQALRMLAGRDGLPSDSVAQRFSEFAELYLEHEAAEQDFLQSAFPGPDWALQG
ncbi:MAG: hypothetical protein GTO03_13945 [Planctomycetales bacterium]|nr:hypothetical protein [Planctomycetales bacterium]